MCTVSNVGDHYNDLWKNMPWRNPTPAEPHQPYNPLEYIPTVVPAVTREEFDQLRKDVDEMMVLLKEARQQDIADGNPDCEMEEKLALLRKVAGAVGVDLDEAFK